MPIHLNDLDVVSEVEGLSSVLIVPCYMCPAVTVAVRENKPFIQLFRSFLKSPPFEKYIRDLQSKLREKGVASKVFKSKFFHQWFLCMWTSGRGKSLQRYSKQFDALIVLGCDSATKTVLDLVNSTDIKVIQGMEISGITNAKPRFSLPCNISFEDSKVIDIIKQKKEEDRSD
jgi:hypothetical protein